MCEYKIESRLFISRRRLTRPVWPHIGLNSIAAVHAPYVGGNVSIVMFAILRVCTVTYFIVLTVATHMEVYMRIDMFRKSQRTIVGQKLTQCSLNYYKKFKNRSNKIYFRIRVPFLSQNLKVLFDPSFEKLQYFLFSKLSWTKSPLV